MCLRVTSCLCLRVFARYIVPVFACYIVPVSACVSVCLRDTSCLCLREAVLNKSGEVQDFKHKPISCGLDILTSTYAAVSVF